MINRENVVKLFNKVNNKRISADSESLIEGFVDLDIFGVTEEMLVQAIESGRVTTKEQLIDSDFIKSVLVNEPIVEPVIEPVVEPTVEPVAQAVDPNNPFGMFEQMISGLVKAQCEPIVSAITDEKFTDWCVQNPNKIKKTIEFEFPQFGTSATGVTHELFGDVLATVVANEPVLLVGSAGTGKNHLVKQVADAMELEFYFANSVKQEHQLLGFIDANGNYHETQFYKAYTQGGVFLLDELDGSDSNALVTFNSAIGSTRYCDFPVGRVYAHENFRVVAAANTFGKGASLQYVGRNEIDDATLDRFQVIEIDYSEQVEDALTNDTDLLEFIRRFRRACEEYGINHIVSYRAIERLNKFKDAIGCEKALKYGLIKNLRSDDINMLRNKFDTNCDEWSTAFMDIARGC